VPEKQLVYWVKVKHVKELLESRFEEKQEWLTTAWIGRALRRLGFTDKRRLGTGYEYNIPSATLEDLRLRMQIEEAPEEPEQPKGPEVKSCFLCNMALPKDLSNTTTLDGKEVHIACYKQTMEGARNRSIDQPEKEVQA
jgi:hypothetical protein